MLKNRGSIQYEGSTIKSKNKVGLKTKLFPNNSRHLAKKKNSDLQYSEVSDNDDHDSLHYKLQEQILGNFCMKKQNGAI